MLNTVPSVAQLLSDVQQAAAELRKPVRVGHALHVSAPRKQADINAPGLGKLWHDHGVTRPTTDQRRRALLAEAERAIKERHGEFDLGLSDIAESVGCSARQLQRVFRETGDTEFRRVLLAVRMERARRLLSRRSGHWPVRKVARAVGYREASGLRQNFVRFYGYNPSVIQPDAQDFDAIWQAIEQGKS